MPDHLTVDAYLGALDGELAALESALAAKQDHEIWKRAWHALGWLYQYEGWAKHQRSDYYARRNEDADGTCLAALIWVRGLLLHTGSALAELRSQEVSEIYYGVDGEWRKVLNVYVGQDGGWQEASTIHVAARNWAPRAEGQVPGSGVALRDPGGVRR